MQQYNTDKTRAECKTVLQDESWMQNCTNYKVNKNVVTIVFHSTFKMEIKTNAGS